MDNFSEFNRLTERLAHLESNQAFQEESIKSLEKTVAQQYQAIQQLEHKLKLLSEYLKNIKQDSIKNAHEETPPPHY